jgi:hypothetical protein
MPASFIVKFAILKSTPRIGTMLSWFLKTKSKNVKYLLAEN